MVDSPARSWGCRSPSPASRPQAESSKICTEDSGARGTNRGISLRRDSGRVDGDPAPLPSVETTPSLAPHSLPCRTKLWAPTGHPASAVALRPPLSSLPLPPAAASRGHLPNTPFAPVSSSLGLASREAHTRAGSWQLRVKPQRHSHRHPGQEARLKTPLGSSG